MSNERNSSQGMGAIGSLAGYAMSDSDEDLDDMHKISGNISGSDDEHSSHSKAPSRTYSPIIKESELLEKKKSHGSSLALVDYGEPDDENSEQNLQVPGGSDGEHNSPAPTTTSENVGVVDYENTLTGEELSAAANNDITHPEEEVDNEDSLIPPSPPGPPPHSLIEKIGRLSKRPQGSLDTTIKSTKDFRNPSIYEKLLSHLGVNEKGTNYPPELYDPSIWSTSSYYDELAKLQNIEMEKRKAEKKDRVKVEFITSTKSTTTTDTSEGSGAKKSKWDTAGQQQTTQTTSTAGSAQPPVGSLIKKK